MSFIRKKKNKDGKVYAYKVTSIWDPEKKQPRSISKYLGAVGIDGNIIPSGEKQKIRQPESNLFLSSSYSFKTFREFLLLT